MPKATVAASKKTPSAPRAEKARKATDAKIPAGAEPAKLPLALAPQLATLVDKAPPGDQWVYEIKFDGYRVLTRVDGDDIRIFTRNGHDWTPRLKGLALAIKRLKVPSGWIDGEIVAIDEQGAPNFNALQNAFDSAHTDLIQYFVFDLPFYDGHDLRNVELRERRALLREVLERSPSERVRFSEDFKAAPADILKNACKMRLEGVIGKRIDSPYVSRRSPHWIKLKCTHRQEFVIAGYTDPQGSRTGIGALLLGIHDEAGKLRFAGSVGTGFDTKTLAALRAKLEPLTVDKSPLFEKPREARGHWVKPKLIAEISFAQWTKDGKVRHAVLHGLRTDKSAAPITKEKPVPATKVAKAGAPQRKHGKAAADKSVHGVRISNPERVIDPSTGIRKIDLVNYYLLAAKRMLPHLEKRPVALVRAPSGIKHQLFFQKHGDTRKFPHLKQLEPALDPGHPPMLEIDSFAALIGAAQMNVIEFHTWNATTKAIERPDRMTFDLDPGEGVTWPMMLEAAELTRTILDELGLRNFLKTSGGKGLHIVVPLAPRDDWDTVKNFSKAVVEHLANTLPSHFVAKSGPKNRVGKIFVDYLRNGRGATTIAAFSARARPGLGVSIPCAWEELEGLTGGAQWTITSAHERLESGGDPWADYKKVRQTLTNAMKKLGVR